ncbi:MAG: formylglycine-generating enzyme family protein, partial [Verrucomicrobiota bacterium]
EFAARGGKGRAYPWGDEVPTPQRANYDEAEIGHSSPVGIFPSGATPDGVLDLAGNVWEWCRDGWGSSVYEKRQPRVDDPEEPSEGRSARVVRGGSWGNPSQFLASAFRGGDRAGSRTRNLGFRCCLAAAAEHDSLGVESWVLSP